MHPLVRVIIVDEHPSVRRGVRVTLERLGALDVVGEASDGLEALDLAKQTKPTIAIVGIALPKLNGIELVHRLKSLCPRTQVLAFTSYDHASLISEVLWSGASGVILKTDPAEQLLDAIKSITAGKHHFSPSVTELLLDNFMASAPARPGSILTRREREIVQLVAEGLLSKEIAGALDINVKTVESHRASAMKKLRLRTTADLVRYAIRIGMVEP